jgi:hypothetical protein
MRERWGKLHNEELHSFYSSLNIMLILKSRRVRWAVHVECVGVDATIILTWLSA